MSGTWTKPCGCRRLRNPDPLGKAMYVFELCPPHRREQQRIDHDVRRLEHAKRVLDEQIQRLNGTLSQIYRTDGAEPGSPQP